MPSQSAALTESDLVLRDSTLTIAQALTRAIVAHRLQPAERLKEQHLADQFGVSRTLVRQALHQLSQKHLIRIEPSRGAFVCAPSVREAREVFAVRALLESATVELLIDSLTPNKLKRLRDHLDAERDVVDHSDITYRVELLGDFHILITELVDNEVLTQALKDLISRCSLITLLYQSDHAAVHSHDEHVELVNAIADKNKHRASLLMREHLGSVLSGLNLND